MPHIRFHISTAGLGALALALVLLGPGPRALAANCGGAVACKCGDTVTRTTTLGADLGVCTAVGLKVASGVTLDCAGHTITGSTKSAAKYGILVDSGTNTTVKNCRVTGFRRGIRLYAGQGNQVTGNETFANHDYGIELAGGSMSNLIASNNVHDNRDEGIHVGAGAHNNEVRQNTLTKNKNENLYVLSSNGCLLVQNTATRTEGAGIFIKHSNDTYVADNTVVNGPITIRGDSTNNHFENNSLRGNGYFFQAYQDTSTGMWTYPHDNTVTGGKVENTTTCLRFAGAYDNVVEGLQLDSECQVTMWALGGQDPTGNQIDTLPLP
jgi:parallel beta-helix repeat protein